jgi:hypothetical protein
VTNQLSLEEDCQKSVEEGIKTDSQAKKEMVLKRKEGGGGR